MEKLNRQDATNAKVKTIDTVDALFVDLSRAGKWIDGDLLRVQVRMELTVQERERIRCYQQEVDTTMAKAVGRLRKKLLG